jgi:nucleotide-binding universal stress UspA family protein
MKPTNQTTGGVAPVSKILVPTDFSPQARNALDWAQYLARAFGARLILLHVIDISGPAEVNCAMGGVDLRPLLREVAQKDMDKLRTLAPDAETLVREASVRPAIVEAARELECQIIVMGTHGRSGLPHLLLGSVAEYVVRHSSVPVLTIRAQREQV